MVYLAYQEGAREFVADRRLENLMERLPNWSHHSAIRVPLILLVRLYPRVLDGGRPDLIGSSLKISGAVYGDPATFDYFPQRIFTPENDTWVD